MKVAVSILSSNYDELKTIEMINQTDADYIHVDVMDGKFVKEKTPNYEHLHKSEKKLNVHLMTSNPFNYISKYSLLNTESIIISSEIDDDIASLIEFIHSRGLKAGLAISPSTKVERIVPYLHKIENVIVMTVEPGKGGQKLLESTLYKIDILRKYREEKKYNYDIIVDGGVNDETIGKVKNADIVVAGSYICKSNNFSEKISNLRL